MRPNILLFFTDDQRFDTIRAWGNPDIHTPNLDRLAARGTSFTRAHIMGGTSAAVCMPSRAMLHTGRTLFRIQDEGQEIPPDHTLLGEHFRAAGYAAYGVGKWHNGCPAYARGFSGGAEIFFGGMDDHWNVPACDFDPAGRYDRLAPFVRDPFHTNATGQRRCDHIRPGVHSTDLFTDAAIRLLETRERARPFLMYLSLMAPHDPRTMPRRFLDLYPADRLPLPPNFAPAHAIDTGALDVRDERLAARPRDPAEIRRHIAEYFAMITHLDDALGRVLAALERDGDLDSTVIAFAGDNGLALGQHGLMGKQNLYDHSVRVPLILAGPGVPAGRRRDALVLLSDLFPTLCCLAGIPAPASVEGHGLAPCLRDGAAVRDDLYLAYCGTIRAVTDGRRKLIEYASGATQLFDLEADPFETRNLAPDGAHPDLPGLRRRLGALAAAHGDLESTHGRQFWRARPDLPGLP